MTRRLTTSQGNHFCVPRANFLNEPDADRHGRQQHGLPSGCPPGSALLVVKRGPNAGSQFLLDLPVTSVADIPAQHLSTTSP